MSATPDSELTPDAVLPDLKRIGVRPSLLDYVRDAWARREFAYTIALGELRAQNQNTVLGSAWHLLNPLLLAAVYYFIFGVILNTGGRGDIDNYPAYLIIGTFVFHFSQKVMIGGTRVVVANAKLIQNINFPRALLPVASVLQETYAQIPALAAMLAIVVATGELPLVTWLLLLPIVAVQSVFNLGFALVLARLTFHFRDTEFIFPYFLRIWFYTSGVFFGVEFVAERMQDNGLFGQLITTGFALNPMYGFIHLTRLAVMGGTTDLTYWRYVLIAATAIIVFGIWFFRSREHEYSRV